MTLLEMHAGTCDLKLYSSDSITLFSHFLFDFQFLLSLFFTKSLHHLHPTIVLKTEVLASIGLAQSESPKLLLFELVGIQSRIT